MSQEKQVKQKQQITVAQLKEDLLNGLNRKAIAAKYDISVSATNKIFKHPELAALRPKGSSDVELIDSTGKAFSPAILAANAGQGRPSKKATEAGVETDTTSEDQAAQMAQEASVSENSGI